jgi:hypothetical protein
MASSRRPETQGPTDGDLTPTSSRLIFPKPQVDERVNRWLHHSISNQQRIMAPSSDTHSETLSSLGDSTYEFIDTDEESRGEPGTESIASLDYGHADDVASLPEAGQSGEEDSEAEEDKDTGGIPDFEGLDGPDNTPTIGQSAAIFQDDPDRTLTQSIEFEEPECLGDENVSVKHTVANFSEEETAKIAERMKLSNPPKRLAATICQTMSRQGLSTKEPLRILYVGCHTAKQDIIRKIASSVAASTGGSNHRSSSGHRASQVYHVVPITAFGSEKPPEIELMESSGYQITVEDCTMAVALKRLDHPDAPEMLRVILDGHFAYHSIPGKDGYVLEPKWELPHVAIVYCSENDTPDMIRTRTVAKTFMSRHRVPSIVISHNHPFEKSFGRMHLDPHAIHMCLESRDADGSRNIYRLPIDLESFKTIDARQMNRNLAFLTELHDPVERVSCSTEGDRERSHSPVLDIEKTSYLSESVEYLRTRTAAEWRAMIPFGVLVLSVLAAVLTSTMRYQSVPRSGVSVNGNLTYTEPTSVLTASSTALESVMTSTETYTSTSTKTVTVTRKATGVPNSVAIKQPAELLGSDPKSSRSRFKETSSSPPSSSLCSARLISETEILITMPSAAKLASLPEEATSINVTRRDSSSGEDRRVQVERLLIPKEGMILQLPREEAWGVVNVSVEIKRGRGGLKGVREIMAVDFGPRRNHSLWSQWLPEGLGGRIVKAEEELMKNIMKAQVAAKQFALVAKEEVMERLGDSKVRREKATEVIDQVAGQVAGFARNATLGVTKMSAIASKELTTQFQSLQQWYAHQYAHMAFMAQAMPDAQPAVQNALVRAQVQSRLFWLRLQGKEEQAREYEAKAAAFLRDRKAEMKKQPPKAKGCMKGRRRGSRVGGRFKAFGQ